MVRQYSPTNKKTDPLKDVNNEKGAILMMTAFALIILAVLFAGMVDYGRVLLIREQNQTATDAAALAAAMFDVKKMVEITVQTTDRKYASTCGDGESSYECGKPEPYPSIEVKRKHGDEQETGDEQFYQNVDVVVTGTEEDLINKGGWKDHCVTDTWSYECSGYTLNDRWVEYTENAEKNREKVAEAFYKANMSQNKVQVEKKRLEVYGDKNHPAYPSVLVEVTVKIKSLFPNMFAAFPETYKTTTCSQGSTYYVNPNTNKFIKAPEDWCWQSPE